MINIGILTYHHPYRGVVGDFYPLIKWKRQFEKEGILFHYYKSHKDRKLFHEDIVIIDRRYYRDLIIHKNLYSNNEFISELATKLRSKGIRVVLFDSGDGAGSNQWDLISYVDVYLKKQVFKNKERYTLNNGVYSYMPFLEKYELSKERHNLNLNYKKEYTPCPTEQLHKIRLGWNIGMNDYRYFPFQRYYPFSTDRFLNSIYKHPAFHLSFKNKSVDSVFRGTINKKNENYSFQRNKVIELFKKEKYPGFITGPPVSKRKYLREMRASKTCVSPFGWGEVCYRDFEATISGSLLIKPDMDYLITYPDIYKKNETYVPIKWDMTDLEETLFKILNNFDDYRDHIINAQRIYRNAITDSKKFIKLFKRSIFY